jgi:hypothetical protein
MFNDYMIEFHINIVNSQCRNAKHTAGYVTESKALPNAGETCQYRTKWP